MTAPTPLRDTVVAAIYQGIDAINHERESSRRLVSTDDLALFGIGGALDSLELMNFIVVVEDHIHEIVGQSAGLTDALFSSTADLPFRSVAALTDYLTGRLDPAAR